MNKFRKIFIFFTFILISTTCFPQNQNSLGWYRAQINGKELAIRLVSDSTYEAQTIWGPSYGYYEILTYEDNPLYDGIIFGDMVYDTKNAFFF